MPVGIYPFEYSYSDFFDRSYSAAVIITVISSADYGRVMGGARTAQLPLF
jgi:hypothetical protein